MTPQEIRARLDAGLHIADEDVRALLAAHEAAIRERDDARGLLRNIAEWARGLAPLSEEASTVVYPTEARIRELEQERDLVKHDLEHAISGRACLLCAGPLIVTDRGVQCEDCLRDDQERMDAKARIRELERERARIVVLIGDDAAAATYQTMGQYRSMLLKALKTQLAASRVIR